MRINTISKTILQKCRCGGPANLKEREGDHHQDRLVWVECCSCGRMTRKKECSTFIPGSGRLREDHNEKTETEVVRLWIEGEYC